MKHWNKTITVYHKQRVTGEVPQWLSATVGNCFAKVTTNRIRDGQDHVNGKQFIVRAPAGTVVSNGDIVFIGISKAVLDENVRGSRSRDFLEQNQGTSFLVTDVHINTDILPHVYIGGEGV